MPLHPVFQAALDAAKSAQRPSLSGGSVAAARELVDAGAKPLGPGPEVAEVRAVAIPGRSGPIAARLYRPLANPAGLLVYFHGGGWVAGSAGSFDALARALAVRSGCAVLNVDYRLAPDVPFPGGLEDAEDAVRWAWQARAELASPEAPLMVGGDSAGGNLATVTARALVCAGEAEIALQLLFYPVLDCDFDTPSYLRWAQGLSLTREDMRWFFTHYAPSFRWADPRISPLRGDLAGAPPVWIAAAEYDVLCSEAEAYALRLQEAGVAVHFKIWAGLTHGFARWFNLVDTVSEAIDAAAAALRVAAEAGRKEAAC